MMKVQIGQQHFNLVRRMNDILTSEDDCVTQLIAIELLMASYAMRMSDPADAHMVIDGMWKHAREMLDTVDGVVRKQ